MPLTPGKENIARNIAEMLRAYKVTGMIGNTSPDNLAHATQIASAIAHNFARKGH